MELFVIGIAILAGIANVLSFLWLISFGSKTLRQVLEDRKSGRAARVHPVTPSKRIPWISVVNLIFTVFLIGLVIFLSLQSKGLGFTSIPTNTPTHTATSIPSPLYQADWSSSLNGWRGGSEWSVDSNGMLINNGTNQDNSLDNRNKLSILAPFQPKTANYAVEAQIRFLGQVSSSNTTLFGIILRGGPDLNLTGYFCYILNKNVAKIKIEPENNSQNILSPLDMSWHTYKAVANNNLITFFMDGKQVGLVSDDTFMLPGVVGLVDINSQINIRSFRVYPV